MWLDKVTTYYYIVRVPIMSDFDILCNNLRIYARSFIKVDMTSDLCHVYHVTKT